MPCACLPFDPARRALLQAAASSIAVLGMPAAVLARAPAGGPQSAGALMRPVDFSQVSITDGFWRPKQDTVATATLTACIVQTEHKTGRIRNFEKAARRKGEAHEGIYYDDSDVYKALEAIAYSLKTRPDAQLEHKADEWIDKIAAAQLPDGYLNTWFTLKGLDQRWTDMEKHEDYCAGHLIEAAIAYYRTTGKRKLLDVAIRLADHIDTTFRVPNRHWVSGHEEIELALMKLYQLTGTDRYLLLADWYLDQRGHGYGKGRTGGSGPPYCQDDVPVKEQRQIVGHAVRAMYLYSGTADVAAATGDAAYIHAMKAVWEDVVYRNMYLTGGIGSSGSNEGFSEDYDLPNLQAYCETCASVGMVLWNQRMAQLTGESQYIDVLERSLYNGALDGLSLSGDRFFYGNPLASTDAHTASDKPGRREWFGTACCPANIARLVASLGSYLYGVGDRDIWVNLFVASSARITIGRSNIDLQLATNYPWEGDVRLTLNPAQRTRCAVHLRIPGWAKGRAVPGDLYRFTRPQERKVNVLVNGRPVRYLEEKGYAVIDREWSRGDVIELQLPMTVEQVVSRDEVKANRNRIALQRGPLVYCAEGADNGGKVWNLIASAPASFTEKPHRVLDEPVIALSGEGAALELEHDGLTVQLRPRTLRAIPYYTWANRDNYEMQVWLPTRIEDVKINS
jgi:DUF1680 family protein